MQPLARIARERANEGDRVEARAAEKRVSHVSSCHLPPSKIYLHRLTHPLFLFEPSYTRSSVI